MGSSSEAIQENYSKKLKAVDYVAFLGKAYEDDATVLREPLMFYHKILTSGRFKGSRMLDVGSGAVVHNVASASAFFPNIVMGDYVENNCEELKRWLRGQSELKQQLQFPAELEGYGGNIEAGVQLIEKRIRKNVKQVVRCDVLSDNIFLEEVKPDLAPPYDLILSSLCLEACPPDFEGFVLILKRLNKLLRPGGGLMLAGFLEGKPWRVAQTDFHHIEISEDDLRKALKESGFGNIDLQVYERLNIDYEHGHFYCLASEKI